MTIHYGEADKVSASFWTSSVPASLLPGQTLLSLFVVFIGQFYFEKADQKWGRCDVWTSEAEVLLSSWFLILYQSCFQDSFCLFWSQNTWKGLICAFASYNTKILHIFFIPRSLLKCVNPIALYSMWKICTYFFLINQNLPGLSNLHSNLFKGF